MQMSAMKVYFQIAECSLSYAKIQYFSIQNNKSSKINCLYSYCKHS